MITRHQWTYSLVATFAAIVVLAVAITSCARRENAGTVYCGPDGQLTKTAPTQSHRSYCVRAFTSVQDWRPKVPSDFAFDIVDDRGATLREFATVHEKIMHVIVVRHDLAQFQHVHPSFAAGTGRFTVSNLILPESGPYRLFADFTPTTAMRGPDGEPMPVTVPVDLEVGGPGEYRPEPLPAPSDVATTNAYEVTLNRPDTLRAGEEARLTFTIREGGKPVTDLEPYLGANGHGVVLREEDLAFIHTHAMGDPSALRTGQLPFMVHFAEPGRYRMFVQFQHRGNVQTAAFTLPTVVSGSSSAGTDAHAGH